MNKKDFCKAPNTKNDFAGKKKKSVCNTDR